MQQQQQHAERMQLGIGLALGLQKPGQKAEVGAAWGGGGRRQGWQRGLLQAPQAAASARLALQLLLPLWLTCSAVLLHCRGSVVLVGAVIVVRTHKADNAKWSHDETDMHCQASAAAAVATLADLQCSSAALQHLPPAIGGGDTIVSSTHRADL